MKIAILGFAGEGQSSYRHWNKSGNEITICDSDVNISAPEGARKQLGPDCLKNLDRFDLLVRTPGLHPRKIVEANPDAPNILDKIWSNTNEFLEVCPTKNIIAITGTKGKGTTCTLIAHMLESIGHTVHLGGNIGIPPLDMLADIKPDDWVILELSSFQLCDLKSSPHIAVCLMVEPEHLNWHEDMDEYIEAKRQLFLRQSEDDIAVYYAENHYSQAIASASSGLTIPYMAAPGAEVTDNAEGEEFVQIDGHKIIDTKDIRLLGKHNWQNICAAITAVWNVSQDVNAIEKAVAGFHGLPHRLEKVREVGGVYYYNDSFSSAPGATIAALNAIPGTKVLIVGGVDKNLDLDELARNILVHKDQIRRIVIIGEVAHKIERELKAHGLSNYDILKDVTMSQIVEHAGRVAQNGDSVVLSPGTSSFDMFKNFEDRGTKYKEAVNKL